MHVPTTREAATLLAFRLRTRPGNWQPTAHHGPGKLPYTLQRANGDTQRTATGRPKRYTLAQAIHTADTLNEAL